LVLCLACAAPAADRKKKAPKPPDLEVVEASAHRNGDKIAIEGRIRNTGERPIRGLILIFDFLAPGSQVITTQKGPIDEDLLEMGKEAVFRMELNEPPRAVEFQIQAVDGASRDLRVVKGGPFPIE
jgi:hypothetical protein